MPDYVEYDGVTIVVGIHRMEHIAGLYLEPSNICIAPSRGITPTRAGYFGFHRYGMVRTLPLGIGSRAMIGSGMRTRPIRADMISRTGNRRPGGACPGRPGGCRR